MSKIRWKNDDIFTTLNKSDFENDHDEDDVNSLEYDDLLIENNKIWFVVLIMTLFSINYLYGYTQSKINTTETIIYW
jgi:hypothetical protein